MNIKVTHQSTTSKGIVIVREKQKASEKETLCRLGTPQSTYIVSEKRINGVLFDNLGARRTKRMIVRFL